MLKMLLASYKMSLKFQFENAIQITFGKESRPVIQYCRRRSIHA